MKNTFEIIIDESVDYAIVDILKVNNFNVYAIIDESPSISDKEVLAIACKQSALLITEDKDFGELVFRFQLSHKGILLLRMIDATSFKKAEAVLKALLEYHEEMIDKFCVLDDNKLRVRNYHG